MARRQSIPTTLALFKVWVVVFSAKVSTLYAALGISSSDATALAALVTDFLNKCAVADDPATKTKVTTALRKTAMQAALAKCRVLARAIRGHAGVTPAQLSELGLLVPDNVPTPAPVPGTKPVLAVKGNGHLRTTFQARDELTPHSSARPEGATGLQAYVKIGDTPPASLDDCKFAGVFSRGKFVVEHPADAGGKRLWAQAVWMNQRGETGPASDLVSTTIVA